MTRLVVLVSNGGVATDSTQGWTNHKKARQCWVPKAHRFMSVIKVNPSALN